jgi:hypothetical protein
MPALQDPRHEAFAQARARSMLLIDAYEAAGFVGRRGHPSRLALKDEVAERIAELRAAQTEMEDTSPLGLRAEAASGRRADQYDIIDEPGLLAATARGIHG